MINEIKYGKLYWQINDKEKYREMKNDEEAKEWGNKYYNQWASFYKRIMQMAQCAIKEKLCAVPIESYCGDMYRYVNSFLRGGKEINYLSRELADVLSIVLCSAPRIPCDLVLYRMVDDEFIHMLIECNKKSRPIQEKGFMSTSLIRSIANAKEAYASCNNMLKIYVPKNSVGVYVNVITERAEEEMLLLHGLFLALISYPYRDTINKKTIFECQLVDYYCE